MKVLCGRMRNCQVLSYDTPTHPDRPHDRRGTSRHYPVSQGRGCVCADGGNVRTLDIDMCNGIRKVVKE